MMQMLCGTANHRVSRPITVWQLTCQPWSELA
jgi:hypothetical protein